MPILPRYLLKQFWPAFALCLALFTGVLLMNNFIKLFNLAIMKGASPLWIAGCFARLLPYFMSIAVPTAFLVAMLLTLGQISERGEALALRASGFSFGEMTWPFLAVSAALSALLFYVNHKASPDGFHSFRQRYTTAAQQIGTIDLRPQTLMRLGPWRLFAKDVSKAEGRLSGVYMVRPSQNQALRLEAPRGQVRLKKGVGLELELEDGSLAMPQPDPETFTSAKFRRYRLWVPLSGLPATPRSPDIQELDSKKLHARIKLPETTLSHRAEYAAEIAARSSGALSPLIFFWIGAPLGLSASRQSRARSWVLSLAILFAFYGLLVLGIGLGRRSESLAHIAPWIGDAAGLAAGLILTLRARKH